MAGLLDFLSPSQGGWMTPDMQKAQMMQGLLGMSQGLMQASGPSRIPVSFGQAMGQGLQGMQSAQDKYRENAMQETLLGIKAKEPMYAMMKEGLSIDPKTGQITPVPGYGAAKGSIEADKLKATLPYDLAKASAGSTKINNNMQMESEFQKKVGGEFGQQYADMMKSSMQAPGKVARLDRLQTLLDGVNTGKFKGTTTEIKSAAKSAGIDLESLGITDDVGPVQAAQALSNAMALEMRNPSGGAGMPGALSDADREFLLNMTPNINQTPEGRAMMVDTQKKLAQREQQVAKLAAEYRRKNGGRFDEGFYETLAQWSAANPLFAGMPTAAPAAPATGGWSIRPKGQ